MSHEVEVLPSHSACMLRCSEVTVTMLKKLGVKCMHVKTCQITQPKQKARQGEDRNRGGEDREVAKQGLPRRRAHVTKGSTKPVSLSASHKNSTASVKACLSSCSCNACLQASKPGQMSCPKEGWRPKPSLLSRCNASDHLQQRACAVRVSAKKAKACCHAKAPCPHSPANLPSCMSSVSSP